MGLGVALLLPGSFTSVQTRQTVEEHGAVSLADGSRIELNTDSRIEIDFRLDCRCVRLSEGAVFNVAHGDPRPFKVLVSQGTLRDIGTAF
jgi:transmembrane sensor